MVRAAITAGGSPDRHAEIKTGPPAHLRRPVDKGSVALDRARRIHLDSRPVNALRHKVMPSKAHGTARGAGFLDTGLRFQIVAVLSAAMIERDGLVGIRFNDGDPLA